jgi:uncharacterized protein YoxC
MMSIELSLTIIAISVVLLVIFGIIVSIFAIQLLCTFKKTTKKVESRVDPLLEEANKIVSAASGTTERIKQNIELTTPLFHSIGRLSTLLNDLPHRFKPEMHDNVMNINFDKSAKRRINIGDWAEWLALGVVLMQKLRHK